ncbi:hypothetical protein CC80DRAFT_543018 [Byssothecium circinans]|uniref:Uncharacterized protein n=1 Tax=Byssothecium circinans TaxID=147558 RepID=A0A6A5U910_9PLEO|nr:hypothetical protein CC80DRAFT_543018 [Byssothecium circinans]
MELFTGYQAYQSSLNQAHDLSLLAPTIQADALKKRAIQANASAWIGLIVDNYGGSELKAAALHGHASIIEILLESGADVHTAKDCLYAAARKGFVDIVQMLLDSGMDPNKGDTAPLVGAVESEHIAMFRLLVQRGAIVARVLPEATRRAEAAGLESMLALLREYETPGSMEQLY